MIPRTLAILLSALPGCMSESSNDVLFAPAEPTVLVVARAEDMAATIDATEQWRICGHVFRILRDRESASDWVIYPDFDDTKVGRAVGITVPAERAIYIDSDWVLPSVIAHELGHAMGYPHTPGWGIMNPHTIDRDQMVTKEDCR